MKQILISFTALALLGACGKAEKAPEEGAIAEGPSVETVAVIPRPPEFQQCMTCHTDKAGETDKIGPNLFGVVGSQAGTNAKKFLYSPEMERAGFTWDRAKLDAYIENPKTAVPGNKMLFAGEKNPARRKVILDYLETLR